jgi:Uncharacterized conserved protein
MTFSICVREQYEGEDGAEQTRYGVAVTTRLAAVGTLCPFANEHGAVATQSFVNVDLGRKGVEYLADGLAVEDALEALLHADDGSPQRQLHGVGSDGEFAFSGEECKPWYGDITGENFTVAGNLLTGESVIESTAEAYRDARDEERPLAERLADALAAGHAEGGDKREDLRVRAPRCWSNERRTCRSHPPTTISGSTPPRHPSRTSTRQSTWPPRATSSHSTATRRTTPRTTRAGCDRPVWLGRCSTASTRHRPSGPARDVPTASRGRVVLPPPAQSPWRTPAI